MVVQYNKEQNAIFFNSLSQATTFLEDKSDAVSYHFSLSSEVDSLRKENSNLKQILINLDIDFSDKESFITDESQQYISQSARVIKNSVHKHHNYLILDRGTEDGIKKHSAVISDNGIVGIVHEVSSHYCLVMSILNQEARISAALKNKNAHGSLVWNAPNLSPLQMNLENIPKHIQPIERGDTIITSGFSAMFPKGLMVGTVDTAWIEQGKGAHTISVNLSEDISTLKYVFIVTNLMKSEIEGHIDKINSNE